MYQLSLTARQYTDSTVYSLSLWQMLPNGGKEQILLKVTTVPGPTEGLFEETPREVVAVALAHFAGMSENIE
jgi:hypothetical protein